MCLPFPIVRSKQVKGLLTNRDVKVWSCTLMKKGYKLSKGVFFGKRRKFATFRQKKESITCHN
jgi:hypothetical protein